MNPPRLTVSPRLREIMTYDKLAGPVPRVLILESRYWLDIACQHACRQMGWDYRTVPVVMEGTLPREALAELFAALAEFRPDFIFTVNLSGLDVDGLFARFFQDLRLPYVTWFVDNPRTIVMDRTHYGGDYTVALTWEPSYIPYLHAAGFAVVEHMPLAVDPVLFDAEPADTWERPAAFVGHSNHGAAAVSQQWLATRPDVAEAMRRAFAAGRVTREAFANGLEAILDESTVAALDAEARRHAEILLFTEGTHRLRTALAQTLASEGLSVHGDEGWRLAGIEPGPAVPYQTELPRFYRSTAVNLNVTSIQMATTVNQRVFDCPAAGGFLLTDAQSGLTEILEPGTEVAIYNSLEEARDLLRYYRDRPHERRTMISRARARILREHTYAHRLQTITRIIRERFVS